MSIQIKFKLKSMIEYKIYVRATVNFDDNFTTGDSHESVTNVLVHRNDECYVVQIQKVHIHHLQYNEKVRQFFSRTYSTMYLSK